MREMFWVYLKRYMALGATVLVTILAITTLYHNIGGDAVNIARDNMIEDSNVFSAYVDDTIEGRLDHLRQLAKTIDISVYQNSDEVKEALRNYKGLFSSLTILTINGAKEYGDHITLKFDEEEILEQLVYDRKAVVYSDSVRELSNKEVIVMAVPIETDGKVCGIIAGTVSVDVLNNVMDKWGLAQEGCAFLITTKGKYITRGKKFNEILGGKANSFFTYLANSSMTGEVTSLTDVENAVAGNRQVTLSYRYGGNDYIGVLSPSAYEDWYIGYVEAASELRHTSINMGKDAIFLLVLSAILWGTWIVAAIVLIHKNCKAQIELERYYMLNQLERSIIFEFQFEPKRLSFFGDCVGMFGKDLKTLYGEEVYEVYQYVHEDDRSVRGRIHRFYDDETRKFLAELRIKNSDGYGWYRITGILIKDKRYGGNQKFIGKIEDANQQIAEEKSLVQRAENDLLTGVLNKKTMEEKVTECLQNISGNTCYIFFMVDLDNFKNVNDKLGHIYGDTAIVDTAKLLSEVFSKNAFIGRLGGDEFAVCASYDAFDEESLKSYIKKKAEKICEVNRRTYVNGAVSISISSSVGIAVATEPGIDFETIYKKADSALYRSKNGGKNCYHIYKE